MVENTLTAQHTAAPAETVSAPGEVAPVMTHDEAAAAVSSQPAGAARPTDLRVSPAAHLADAMRAAEVTGPRSVALREIRFAVQIGLRAEPGSSSARALEQVLGVDLPVRHGQTTGDPDGQHVLWLGPDDFLAVDTSREQQPGDDQDLAAALEGLPGQAVDLSANRTILELTGTSAREALEKGCQADLHPRAFPVGHAIATQIGQVPVILHRSAEQSFRLFPRASFADFLVRWLLDAMEEFGQEPVA